MRKRTTAAAVLLTCVTVARAQQLPPARCGAVATCQPSGFQTLLDDAGESASFFGGIRAHFGRGLEIGIIRPYGWSDPFARQDPVAAAADLFVRRHPLGLNPSKPALRTPVRSPRSPEPASLPPDGSKTPD